MKKIERPELLAPAGGMNELKAAVSSGADAVYLGGRLFNARMNAGNFDHEEMREAVAYAHLRGVKVYVTMNTLLFDDELEEAVRYAASLYEMGVDALIIQDLGLGSLIKRYIPGFELHLSTQGTVYNQSGARAALALGYERVVAAREMSLSEIKEMAKVCDTEVFVHGAICMCYSGQCQLSRSIGGRSGNRGQCAQPCRLLYEDENGRKGYWLSPKDLCLVDRLGELIEAGVRSFKIEGRMKSPEYVAVVTGIYRKYIDAYMAAASEGRSRAKSDAASEGRSGARDGETGKSSLYNSLYNKEGKIRVSQEDRQALMQIFSRGQFTEGYIDGQPERFLSGDLPKHQGILIGHVLGRGHHDLVRVQLSDELEMGDGVEIRGGAPGERKPAGNVVTYMEVLSGGNGKGAKERTGRNKERAGLSRNKERAGSKHESSRQPGAYPVEMMIGDIRGDVRPGDLVYRISSSRQLEEAGQMAAGDLKKIPVRMSFFGMPGKEASLTLYCEDHASVVTVGSDGRNAGDSGGKAKGCAGDSGGKVSVKVESDTAVEPAISSPTGEDFVRDKLSKTGDTVYLAEKINVKLTGDCYIPASLINGLRRQALELLDEKRLDMKREPVELPKDLGEQLQRIDPNGARGLSKDEAGMWSEREPHDDQQEDRPKAQGGQFAYDIKLPEITKGVLDEEIKAQIGKEAQDEEIYNEETHNNVYNGKKVLVNNLGWTRELIASGAAVYGGRGLNVTNKAAAAALAGIGVTVTEWSKELEEEPDRLMITEYDLPQRMLKDGRGNQYIAVKENGKSVIVPRS